MNDNEIQLRNIDPDDVDDMIAQVQKTFRVSFIENDLDQVKTFGQFCQAVLLKTALPHQDGCANQQAFYKLREAITEMGIADRDLLAPSSKLDDLFLREGRRDVIKQLEQRLGVTLNILKPRPVVYNILAVGYVAAVVLLIFSWQAGVALFIVTAFFNRLANFFACEFKITTLGELAWLMVKLDYFAARRNPHTVNRAEVLMITKKIFMEGLDLPEAPLGEDAVFG